MSVKRIKKDDVVVAVSGVNAGKSGKVLQVMGQRGRAIVEGVNIVKKTLRKSQDNPQGGISEKEASVEISNLMLYCPHDKKGVKVARIKDGDHTVRKCKLCGHSFGS